VRNVAVRDVVSIVGKPEKTFCEPRWQKRGGWERCRQLCF
jgi:hypothetical protein